MASSMAMNHRKLFPTTNQTVDCVDICDPTCPYECYPYPEYYFIPPPPPPPPPLPPTHSGIHLSPYIIVLIIFTATFFLIIGYYAFFVRRCLRRPRSTQLPTGEGFLDENRGSTIDNPIWYITTVGLQPSVINSITVLKYSKAGGLIDGTDCSVCLNEFQENETLRLLPKCNHAFHIVCIDTWLRSHTNCPMCRCGILSNSESNSHCDVSSNTLNAPHAPLSDSVDNNASHDLGSNQATRVEFPEPDEELVVNQTQDETETETETRQIDDETKESGFWVVDISEDNETEDQIQIHTVKRSLSMNSPSSINHFAVEYEGSSVNSRIFRMMSGSSISKLLHKRPVSMKRSFSYSGRSFLPRHYRNHKAMIRLRSFC